MWRISKANAQATFSPSTLLKIRRYKMHNAQATFLKQKNLRKMWKRREKSPLQNQCGKKPQLQSNFHRLEIWNRAIFIDWRYRTEQFSQIGGDGNL